MNNYFQPTDYTLEKIWFDYLGKRYYGRGSMTWNPEEGFHIEAILDGNNQLPCDRLEFGKIRILGKNSKSSIKMKPENFDWAIVPNVALYDRSDIINHNRLSIHVSRVIFCQSEFSNLDNYSSWLGYSLYKTRRDIQLSDSLHIEEKLNEKLFKSSFRSGIDYEDENQKVVGSKTDKTHIEVHWTHPKTKWSKIQSWKWAEAAQYTFSIWYGETVGLLQRQINLGSKRYLEVRQQEKLYSLGTALSPLESNRRLDKRMFIHLAKFFTFHEQEAFICRQIFNQIMEASHQKSWQATELLIATILEAALRTHEKRPFAKYSDKKDWNIDGALKRFREKYWSRDWKKICKKVLKTHRNLRNRNAHPDWLYDKTGYLSDEQKEKSLDEMIFLSRFYGYIILTLAGVKILTPQFPKPHKEWGPAYVIMSEKEASKNPIFNLLDQIEDYANDPDRKS